MPSTQEGHELKAIPVKSLDPKKISPMDFYIQRNGDNEPILYRSQSLPLTKNEINELLENEITTLWVRPKKEKTKKKEVIEESAEEKKERKTFDSVLEVIQDDSVPTEGKCDAVYSAAEELMREVYESNQPADMIRVSSEALEPITEVIFGDKKAAHEFILRASVDYALYTHSLNTCLYGISLARKALGISKKDALERFGPGFLLHDIGKLKIPREVLDKEDSLDDDEWTIIQRHPAEGLRMVKEFIMIPSESEQIILYHHERLDGSGYPYGLKGEDIPIGARICAIVDEFDALSTRRPFRDRKTSFDAFLTMKKEVGRGLDEDLFRAFLYLFVPPEA